MKKILIVILAALVVIVLMKDAIAKFAIEKGVTQVTGLELSMKKFKLGIASQLVHIEGLKLKNPEGFEEENMVDLPEVFVQVDIPAIFGGKVHVKELRLNLAEFAIIKNKDGELNLDALKVVEPSKDSKAPKKEEPKKESKPVDLQIDDLDLIITKVTYKDHSSVIGKATSKTFDLNIQEHYENITDPEVLVKMIVAQVLKNTTIGKLANIDMSQFADVSAVLDSGKQMATETAAQAQKAIKDAAAKVDVEKVSAEAAKKLEASKEVASKSLESATDSAKDAAESLSGAAGDLFGGIKAKVKQS